MFHRNLFFGLILNDPFFCQVSFYPLALYKAFNVLTFVIFAGYLSLIWQMTESGVIKYYLIGISFDDDAFINQAIWIICLLNQLKYFLYAISNTLLIITYQIYNNRMLISIDRLKHIQFSSIFYDSSRFYNLVPLVSEIYNIKWRKLCERKWRAKSFRQFVSLSLRKIQIFAINHSDWFAHLFLNHPKMFFVFRTNKRDGFSGRFCPAGSSNAMNIILG